MLKDYTVSKQVFDIWHCNDCTGRFTQAAPHMETIGAWYKSADYVSHSDTRKGFDQQVVSFSGEIIHFSQKEN